MYNRVNFSYFFRIYRKRNENIIGGKGGKSCWILVEYLTSFFPPPFFGCTWTMYSGDEYILEFFQASIETRRREPRITFSSWSTSVFGSVNAFTDAPYLMLLLFHLQWPNGCPTTKAHRPVVVFLWLGTALYNSIEALFLFDFWLPQMPCQ